MLKMPQGSGQKPTYRHAPRRRPDATHLSAETRRPAAPRPPAATRRPAVARTSAEARHSIVDPTSSAARRPATTARTPAVARPPAATRWSAVTRTSVPRRSPRPAPAPSARRRIPAAPFLGVAAVAAVALLTFVMVPAVGGLFSNTRNDTDTSAKGQTVAEWRAPRTALVERLSGAGSTVAAQAENPPRYLDLGTTKTGEGRVSFSAVGDNLFNENLLDIADAAAGVAGDGKYGFDGFYRKIKKKIASYDISFVNQETTLGGPDRYGYNGYPS